MDNRIDHTEDLQSTPEHPAGRVPGMPSEAQASGLTAGPHNDPPRSQGVIDTSQTWQERYGSDGRTRSQRFGGEGLASRIKGFTQSVSGNPLPWLIGAAGLTVLLLALQRTSRH